MLYSTMLSRLEFQTAYEHPHRGTDRAAQTWEDDDIHVTHSHYGHP